MALAEKLGSFAGQLTDSEVRKDHHHLWEGNVAELKTKALIAAAIAGFLRPSRCDVERRLGADRR